MSSQKNLKYLLAIVVVLCTFAFDGMFFFIDFPQQNRDMINTLAGTLNTGALFMVLSYFFRPNTNKNTYGES